MNAFYKSLELESNEFAEAMERHDRTQYGDRSYSGREMRFLIECIAPNYDPSSGYRRGRAPFLTTVAPSMVEAACEAIRYFTGTQAIVHGTDHQSGRVVIESKGQN